MYMHFDSIIIMMVIISLHLTFWSMKIVSSSLLSLSTFFYDLRYLMESAK